jgi:hypothetical protein
MGSEPISFLFMLNEILPPLLEPRRLGDLLLPNRVVMAPPDARASKQSWARAQ